MSGIISVIDYNSGSFTEQKIKDIDDQLPVIPENTVRWINIEGLDDTKMLDDLCSHFNFHPLVKDDILIQNSRPKLDDHNEYVFTSVNILKYNFAENTFDLVKLNIILGKNYVITVSQNSSDVIDDVKNRINKNLPLIQKHGADYLQYVILDTVIESYFDVLEQLNDRVDAFEDETVINPSKETLYSLQYLRRQTLMLNKTFWPLREILAYLERGDSSLIDRNIRPYLRSLYEHIIQIIDTTESIRDLLSGVMDIYLSSVSNRMNEIMKVLTIISTVFMPLSFLASFYGMNFQYMPELSSPIAYPILICVMLAVSVLMIYYFKKKKWW